MVPHRVILAESSILRRVLERKSRRPRRVLKYRLKFRVSIYLFLSVGRKMTPFPETVSDPKPFVTPEVIHCEQCNVIRTVLRV